MQRLLYIARFEYLRHIKRRIFLLTTFGVPLLMVAGSALVFLALVLTDRSERTIGYVDQAGVIQADASLPTASSGFLPDVPVQPYPDEAAAQAAFTAGKIDAYVVFPVDYLDTGVVQAYGREALSDSGELSLRRLLRASLLDETAPQVADLALNPTENLTFSTLDGSRTTSQSVWTFLLPYLFGLLFLITIFSSSGYLLQAIVEEKENRTMEIVVTSVTPQQLIGGKTLGLGALGLTQTLVWCMFFAVPAVIGSRFSPLFQGFDIPFTIVFVVLLAFILGYLLFASLMVGVGAMVTSTQESQQFASFFSLMGMLPFILNFLIITNPNGPLAVGMSLFPLTAPLTLVMRLPLTEVPLWQIGLSLSLLAVSNILVMLGVARIFRAGMLRYGKAIKFQELFSIVRTKSA